METTVYLIICWVLFWFCLLFTGALACLENCLYSISEQTRIELEKSIKENHPCLLYSVRCLKAFFNTACICIGLYILLKLSLFGTRLPEILQIVLLAVFILGFGNILPKILVGNQSDYFAKKLIPLLRLSTRLRIGNPIIEDQDPKSKNISREELSSALDLASTGRDKSDESNILKGVVKLSELEVSNIMQSRAYVVGVERDTNFTKLMHIIQESSYSRMPVYQGNLDNIQGVLNIKDLLPYINEGEDFNWCKLIRTAIFVPETKKLDRLLKELQEKKVHLAIVVDEFGGTSGIISLEDIMEEVVGEISDEFDTENENILFKQIDANTFLFDARMPIHDFCKVLNLRDDFFEDYDGEFETLAGFVLEVLGSFPIIRQQINLDEFSIIIEEIENKRIKKLRFILKNAK